jgi:Xaa-Pro aminopeptidase
MKSLINLVPERLSKIGKIPFLSRLSPSSAKIPSEGELQSYRNAQKLAYRCALEIGRELREGWTEKRTSTLMDTWLKDHGVKSAFHKSFAWFGDRTRFKNFHRYDDFLPSSNVLRAGDVIVLDTAPVVDGYVADIGFSFALQPHPELARARKLLLDFRTELPLLFGSFMSSAEIWTKVDERLKEEGFANCHKQYPFGVLGHRVHEVPFRDFPSLLRPFGWHAYWALLSRGLFPELLGPWHVGEKTGLWALEPHLGGEGFGAKFEEILVVDEEGARWLDDEVPHVNLPAGFY